MGGDLYMLTLQTPFLQAIGVAGPRESRPQYYPYHLLSSSPAAGEVTEALRKTVYIHSEEMSDITYVTDRVHVRVKAIGAFTPHDAAIALPAHSNIEVHSEPEPIEEDTTQVHRYVVTQNKSFLEKNHSRNVSNPPPPPQPAISYEVMIIVVFCFFTREFPRNVVGTVATYMNKYCAQ